MTVSVVVTSIAAPNRVLRALAEGCSRSGYCFYVIGDVSSPAEFNLPGCEFFSIGRQHETGFRTARDGRTRHYARKNVGYLEAIRDGADTILETDDDNDPAKNFWEPRAQKLSVRVLSQPGWVNVYGYFADELVWPRGLPLAMVKREVIPYELCPVQEVDCPIQQGLANENPDVDAIYRMTGRLPILFRADRRIALSAGTWCPFNSQNTVFFREAFALLYLPAWCSFRMTDIWRSLVAQRILWENGWKLLFHEPTVIQDRNDHNLMTDFRDEMPGYLYNEAIAAILGDLPLKAGIDEIGNNLVRCYEALVGAEYFPTREMDLVEAWLADLSSAQAAAASQRPTADNRRLS